MDFFYSLFILFFKIICFFIENSHYIIAAIVVLMLPPLVTLIQQKKDLDFFTKYYLDEIYQWKKLKESLVLFIIYFIFFLLPLEKFSENILIQNISLSIRFAVIFTVIYGMTIFVKELYFHLTNIFFNDESDPNGEYYFNYFKENFKKETDLFNSQFEKAKKDFSNVESKFKKIFKKNSLEEDHMDLYTTEGLNSEKYVNELSENDLEILLKEIEKKKFTSFYMTNNSDLYINIVICIKGDEPLDTVLLSKWQDQFQKCFKKANIPEEKKKIEKRILKKFGQDYYYYIIELSHRKHFFHLKKEMEFLKRVIRDEIFIFMFKGEIIGFEFNAMKILKALFSEKNDHFPDSLKEAFFFLWFDLFKFIGLKGINMRYIINILEFSFESKFLNKRVVSEDKIKKNIRMFSHFQTNAKEKVYDDYFDAVLYNAFKKIGEQSREEFGFNFFTDLALMINKKKRNPHAIPFDQEKINPLEERLSLALIKFSSYCLSEEDHERFNRKRYDIYEKIDRMEIFSQAKEIFKKEKHNTYHWKMLIKMEKTEGSVLGTSIRIKEMLKKFLKDYLMDCLNKRRDISFLKKLNTSEEVETIVDSIKREQGAEKKEKGISDLVEIFMK